MINVFNTLININMSQAKLALTQRFAALNFTLLSTDYKGRTQPLLYRCHCGKDDKTTIKDIDAGNRIYGCKDCTKKQRGEKARLPIEEVKKRFADFNLTLLTIEYHGCSELLPYRCHCGKEDTTTIKNINAGHRKHGCRDCTEKYVQAHRPRRSLKYEDVKQRFSNLNLTLLAPKYENANEPLLYQCHCGNLDTTTIQKLSSGYRKHGCPDCTHKITTKMRRDRNGLNLDVVKERFAEKGYTLLTTEYANADTPMVCACKCGTECTLSLHQIYGPNHAYGCKNCTTKQQKINSLIKWGTEFPAQSKIVQAKQRATMMSHYGVEYALQSEEIRERCKATCEEKYGYSNPAQLNSLLDYSPLLSSQCPLAKIEETQLPP